MNYLSNTSRAFIGKFSAIELQIQNISNVFEREKKSKKTIMFKSSTVKQKKNSSKNKSIKENV